MSKSEQFRPLRRSSAPSSDPQRQNRRKAPARLRAVKKEDCLPRPVPFSFPHDHKPNPAEPGD
jgi:hypothetical protein